MIRGAAGTLGGMTYDIPARGGMCREEHPAPYTDLLGSLREAESANGTISAHPENENGASSAKSLSQLARPERFELPTFWFVARRSIQLS